MRRRHLPSGTVTLLFTDIEGSTRLLHQLGDRYGAALLTHRRLLRHAFHDHSGVEVDTQGDAFFYAFDKAADAVAAAQAGQEALIGGQIRVRMGLHTGEPRLLGHGYVGLDVHCAARICSAAHGGQVAVSEATARMVAAEFRDLGLHRLKDLPTPQHLYQLGHEVFPPLRSLNFSNLPEEVTSLIGREAAAVGVAELIEEHRMVTLTGPGGVGKTRLATRVARTILDRFPDGCWFVDLAAITDAMLVPAALISALRVKETASQSPMEAALSALGDKTCLVLLDNCEHLASAPGEAARALLAMCHSVRILATSREQLNVDGECVSHVEPLDTAESGGDSNGSHRSPAVELFMARAHLHGADVDGEDSQARSVVAELCRRLDGIPLAIELAAARTRSLPPQELLLRLDERFRLLARPRHWTAAARQQTLEATIEWSYSLLSAGEQATLRRLSAFRGGFEMAAAIAVCTDIGADLDVIERVGALVDRSLVQLQDRAAGRYRLLESIGLFAELRLRARDDRGHDEQRQTSQAHCDFYFALVEEAALHLRSADQVSWFGRLDADLANIRAALDLSSRGSAEAREACLRAAAALRRFWRSRGLAREAADLFDRLLGASGAVSDLHLRTRALICAAEMYWDLLRYDEADFALSAAVTSARQIGESALIAEALRLRSWVEQHHGDLERSIACAREAVALAVAAGDPLVLADCLLQQANSWDDEHAAPLGEVVRIFREAGDQVSTARVLNSLALRELDRDDLAAAVRYLDEALLLSIAAQNDDALTPVNINFGFLHTRKGEPQEAVPFFLTALDHSRRTGRMDRVSYALLGLAVCAGQQGRFEVAARVHGAVDALLREIGLSIAGETLEERARDEGMAMLRQHMGDQSFATAYQLGAALGVVDAVAIATRARGAEP